MLLGEIRNYLQQRGVANLQEVATHFDITPDNALFALNYWQKQGKIRSQANSCGSGCSSNSCGNTENKQVFEWIKRDIPLHWITRTV